MLAILPIMSSTELSPRHIVRVGTQVANLEIRKRFCLLFLSLLLEMGFRGMPLAVPENLDMGITVVICMGSHGASLAYCWNLWKTVPQSFDSSRYVILVWILYGECLHDSTSTSVLSETYLRRKARLPNFHWSHGDEGCLGIANELLVADYDFWGDPLSLEDGMWARVSRDVDHSLFYFRCLLQWCRCTGLDQEIE